ncbi:MAG: O-antigen ligase family protein [Moorea sp. SIO2B7]|nr:O-antigen ligase family protein [Moorena sp. SIO2B7]
MTDATKPSLKWAWTFAQLGLLILPLIPALGEVGFFLALILTWKQKYRLMIKQPFNWVLAVLSILLIISSCFAFKPIESWLGLANFLPFFAFLAAFRVLIQKISQLRQLAWIMVIPSLPIVILGFGQLFGGWTIPYILGWELVANGSPPGRMASVFIYANILAIYLLIVFILGLGLLIDTYQAWQKGLKKHQGWVLGFLSITVIGDGIGLILTSSRNAWAIAFVGCVAFALYLGWRWLVLGIATAASSVLWASFGPAPGRDWLRQIIPVYFWGRLSDQSYPDRSLGSLRRTQWQFAWELTKQRPWTGWGLRNFTPLYQEQIHEWFGHPHNLFLMLMAEAGVPMMLLLSGLVGWAIAQAVILIVIWSTFSLKKAQYRRNRDKLMLFTYLVAFGSCILFNIFDVTLFDLRVNTLGWLLLSAICGVVYRYQILIKQFFQV